MDETKLNSAMSPVGINRRMLKVLYKPILKNLNEITNKNLTKSEEIHTQNEQKIPETEFYKTI